MLRSMLPCIRPLMAGTLPASLQAAFPEMAPRPSTSYQPLEEAVGSGTCLVTKRWATKKQAGSTRNRGGSAPKYLGIKMSHGQLAFPGQIILRQRGHKFHPGYHVGVGRDQTLFATTVGFIRFKDDRTERHNKVVVRKTVSVMPVNGNWGESYKEDVEKMVAARALAKARLLLR